MTCVNAKSDVCLASSYFHRTPHKLFTHLRRVLKRILKPDRLRLMGSGGTKDEFHFAATAQTLRNMANLVTAVLKTA